jgi:hypothetical protein
MCGVCADTMKAGVVGWVRYVSFFGYGYEALVANEFAGRQLTDLPVGQAVSSLTGRRVGSSAQV